jgi:hypothetical protein
MLDYGPPTLSGQAGTLLRPAGYEGQAKDCGDLALRSLLDLRSLGEEGGEVGSRNRRPPRGHRDTEIGLTWSADWSTFVPWKSRSPNSRPSASS